MLTLETVSGLSAGQIIVDFSRAGGVHVIGLVKERHLANRAVNAVRLGSVRVIEEGDIGFHRHHYGDWKYVVVICAEDRL